jgi:hypothetical protein
MPRFRPRLNFSLRTMLALMGLLAVGCGYVGYQYQIVRERKRVLELLNRPREQAAAGSDQQGLISYRDVELPWIRRMLGDDPLHWSYQTPDSEEDLARVLAAFPEAQVWKRSENSTRLRPVDLRPTK